MAVSYQGLFFLVSGVSSFLILFLTLRSIGQSRSEGSGSAKSNENEWHDKEQLKIVEIINETADIKSFRLQRMGRKKFDISKPGQFLSFQIGEDTKQLRSYSISASCENQRTLQVSIKSLKDGVGSGWFHSRVAGDLVWAYPPSGLFTDDDLEDGIPRVYIAGGIGITPHLSMITTAMDRSNQSPKYLFYGARTGKDFAFHTMLTELAQRYENFHYFPITSDDEGWSGDKGFLTIDFIRSKIKIEPRTHFYFCGPPPMTDKIMEALIENGHPEDQLHGEKFASPVSFDPANIPHREFNVTFNSETYKYSGKESILEFMERNDIAIPFACRVGVCGTCKCKLSGGTVDAFTDSGLNSKEKRDNYILTCVARPTENIELGF